MKIITHAVTKKVIGSINVTILRPILVGINKYLYPRIAKAKITSVKANPNVYSANETNRVTRFSSALPK